MGLAWANGLIVIPAIPKRIQIFLLVMVVVIVSSAIESWRTFRVRGTGIWRILVSHLKLGAALLLGISALPLPPLHPRPLLESLPSLTLAVVVWLLLIRWSLRANLLGPLLLTASRPRPWTIGIMYLFLGTFWLLVIIPGWREKGSLDLDFTFVRLFLLAAFALCALLSRRVEVRQKGLACSGILIPWTKITSYEWDPNPREFDRKLLRDVPSEFEVLYLRPPRLFLHLGSAELWFPDTIQVKKEFRSLFDDVLTRQSMARPRPTHRSSGGDK